MTHVWGRKEESLGVYYYACTVCGIEQTDAAANGIVNCLQTKENKVTPEEVQVNAVIERLEHAIQSLKDLCGMTKADRTCKTCANWVTFRMNAMGDGVCAEEQNQEILRKGANINILQKVAPVTAPHSMCEYWRRKEGTK